MQEAGNEGYPRVRTANGGTHKESSSGGREYPVGELTGGRRLLWTACHSICAMADAMANGRGRGCGIQLPPSFATAPPTRAIMCAVLSDPKVILTANHLNSAAKLRG